MPFEKMLIAIALAVSANVLVADALAQTPAPTGQKPPPSDVQTPALGAE
jgi:hypothetical protein